MKNKESNHYDYTKNYESKINKTDRQQERESIKTKIVRGTVHLSIFLRLSISMVLFFLTNSVLVYYCSIKAKLIKIKAICVLSTLLTLMVPELDLTLS